jgi:anhydro-N-acetylmuramic acid kinase
MNFGLGIMSGTSLDGLDIAYVELQENSDKWELAQVKAKTFPYSKHWLAALSGAMSLSPNELKELSISYASLIAEKVKLFITAFDLADKIEFVASHGHTVFHEPSKGITVQIGEGQVLADKLGLQVINDFRIKDVLLGGQGAPLVPIGDQLLFGQYQSCLNLGGFSNISFDERGERIAFDIGPCNLPINFIMQHSFGKTYDHNGDCARQGQLDQDLFEALNQLEYYTKNPPKSLGVEWLNTFYMPLLEDNSNPKDLLYTLVKHQAYQIKKVFKRHHLKEVLITGGGAYNEFLIDSLKDQDHTTIVLPANQIIEFKEAIIFAFLGLLRLKHKVNTLKSVTGASEDSCGGTVHYPQ